MSAFFHFLYGAFSQPLWLQGWMLLLILMNFAAPMYFIRKFESKVVFVVFIINCVLMATLTAQFGYTRMLGIGHFLWFPMLWWINRRAKHFSMGQPFGLWLRALIVVNSISLLLDVIDVMRYILGDRAELIPPSS
ncbi:MAG: hypothetical protein KDK78_03635 [Chlamydiia bacterium]|nr:hypothetical protein [Chlamydiia bacterium]